MAQKFTVPITVRQLSSAGSDAFTIYVDGDTFSRLQIQAGGRLVWGPGSGASDTNLYRDAANVLKTDDTFKSAALHVNGIEIDPTGAVNGNALVYNGTKFAPGAGGGGSGASITISDTEPTGATAGDLWFESDTGSTYVYYDSYWVEVGGVGYVEATTLNSLTDVVITSPSSGQVLKYNGTAWVNGTDDAGTTINSLDDIGDVTITSASSGQFLKWNGSAWVNDAIDLGTDTTGNYVSGVTAGTGVTVTHTPSEGSSPTIAIGQAVGTTDSPTFAGVTADKIRIGVTSANKIDTTDGSLSLQPATIGGSNPSGNSIAIYGSDESGTGTVQAGGVTIYGGYASGGTTNNGGNVQIDGGYGSGTPGTVTIGTAYASGVIIGRAGITTTIDGDAVLSGNLTVSGTTTTLNTENLLVEDNIVVLNSGVTASPTLNAGIEVERGTSTNVLVRWNETVDRWESTNDGTIYNPIGVNPFNDSRLSALLTMDVGV